ncbi:hypothetical protein EC991_007993 [Linnemannia zychae]|nr:hypothetical protein EC991_007993 [Linnemannia zychae]
MPIVIASSDCAQQASIGATIQVEEDKSRIHWLENDIHRLKVQRLKEYSRTIYIPPLAKPALRADETTLLPLMERALTFLESQQQVLLLLGDSGAGKSTFNLKLENTLWTSYKHDALIPLYINLPTIDDPAQNLIAKQLQYYDFSEEQIQELKLYREFVLICDGYDESQLEINIHSANEFHKQGQWKVKMVVSCRSQYLGVDYRSRFQPQLSGMHGHDVELMMEAVISPFSEEQIEQYVEQYVKELETGSITHNRPAWTFEEYMEKLTKIPKLMGLVSNPFLLALALEALPGVVGLKKDFSAIRITRVLLYDGFVKHWLDVNKARLESSILSDSERSEFYLILDDADGFEYHSIRFQKNLAAAIFKEQDGQPVVSYTQVYGETTWKSSFFSSDAHTKLLRESSTLTRSGDFFRFIHRSLQEYFYSRMVYDPLDYDPDSDRPPTADPKVALSQRNFVSEPSVLQFLAERVEMDASFKAQLLSALEDSKKDSKAGVAASNAISILVKAEERFNGIDLRGIRIPGADLCRGEFDSVDMEGADLTNINLTKTWLRQANLSKARMDGVQFGELPYLAFDDIVTSIAFSFDGEYLAVCLIDGSINIHDTTTWSKVTSYLGVEIIAASPVSRELARVVWDYAVELGDILTAEPRLILEGHKDEVVCICYSSDGAFIATASKDTTIRIWSTVDGKALHSLSGHSSSVTSVVFSPVSLQLVSCGKDKTVRTWDAQKGVSLAVLEWHEVDILCVAYSPDGRQFASGDSDGTVGLWNAHTGKITRVLAGPDGPVYNMVYSSDGHHIAHAAEGGVIRVHDSHSGELLSTLSGHLGRVTSVAYSPSGDYIVSGSLDQRLRFWITGGVLSDAFSGGDRVNWGHVAISPNCKQIVTGGRNGEVQLWETLTGKPGTVLKGHTGLVDGLAFSPCGQRVTSSSCDGTAMQWCVQTGAALHIFKNQAERAAGVTYSPSGHQITTAGENNTVQLWDALSGEPLFALEGHTDRAYNMVYSPCGYQIATSSEDGTVRLWDACTGEQQFVLKHPGAVGEVIYSPDGQELVSVMIDIDGPRFWDPRSGEPIDRGNMGEFGILSCHYLPSVSLLATGDTGGYLRLWDRSSGDYIEVFQLTVGVGAGIELGYSSELICLVTQGCGQIRFWQLIVKESNQFALRLLWGLGENELTLLDANLCGAVGLSPSDLKLVEQRGAIIEQDTDARWPVTTEE